MTLWGDNMKGNSQELVWLLPIFFLHGSSGGLGSFRKGSKGHSSTLWVCRSQSSVPPFAVFQERCRPKSIVLKPQIKDHPLLSVILDQPLLTAITPIPVLGMHMVRAVRSIGLVQAVCRIGQALLPWDIGVLVPIGQAHSSRQSHPSFWIQSKSVFADLVLGAGRVCNRRNAERQNMAHQKYMPCYFKVRRHFSRCHCWRSWHVHSPCARAVCPGRLGRLQASRK